MNFCYPNTLNISSFKLNANQKEIFQNLNLIGEEIALFYLDGIYIYKTNILKTKPYLLAHIAREIEGGIRDIWASPFRICPYCKKKLKKDKMLCDCGKYKKLSHKEEIAKILELDENSSEVKEWHGIAKEFHKYAHRNGPWKNLRDDKKVKRLWEQFEQKILFQFIGKYITFFQQIDKFIKLSKPTDPILSTLENIFNNKLLENYFFNKLENFEWFPYLKEKNFFSPKKAPGPEPADKEGFYRIPYWDVLNYLEKVSQKVNEPENNKYINLLLEIIKEVTEYHRETQKLDNYHIWASFIRILSNLPNEKITQEIIDLIPIWLNSKFGNELQAMEIKDKLFPKFLTENPEDIKKGEKIIEHITKIIEVDNKKIFIIDNYSLKEFFEKNIANIAEKYTTKIIEIFKKRLKNAISTEYDGTLNSFYEFKKPDYFFDRPVELLSYYLSNVLLIKSKKESENVKQVLELFFDEKLPIFIKIALFIIGQNIDLFKDLFWKIFKKKGEDILEGTNLYWGDELKNIFKNLERLNNEQKNLLKKKIEIATQNYIKEIEDDIEKNEKEKRIAIFKQKIYHALSFDKEFENLYNEMKKITEIDTELLPALRKLETKFGYGSSPLNIQEILLKIENNELADYLIKFKTINSWEGPTIEGLAETLKTAVKTSPEKFTDNLLSFLNVGYLYIGRILEGFQEALKENKKIDYNKIFNFLEKYLDQKKFWENKLKVQSSFPVTYKRVIDSFHFFIIESLKNEENPLPENLYDKLENIIQIILKNLEYKVDTTILNYAQYSINSPAGHVIEIYIKFIIKVLNSTNEKKKFLKNNFVKKYQQLLNESVIEAYTFLGMYFLSFYYHIDKNFTKEIIYSLPKGEEIWEAFMEGYFFIRQINKEVYLMMKDHYQFALNYSFKDNIYKKQLIQHISLAYLMELENLEFPSLFYKILKKFDPDDVNMIISFFWQQKDYLKEANDKTKQIKGKILSFWEFIYNKFKNIDVESLSEKEREILSNISKLTIFIPEFNNHYIEWIKFSARFINDPISCSLFLNNLEKFINTGEKIETAKYISEILLNIKPFSYPKEKIKFFIQYLCETDDNNVKENAKRICENYVKKINDSSFIKEIKEIYQKYF